MDALRAQLAKVQVQLANLTASQRMLAMSLVAVMVLSLVFWAKYAGTSEMEPVLDQAMKTEDVAKITGKIRGMGIPYTMSNDRIMVPADRKLEVLAVLSYERLTPQDTNNAYEEIVSKINPFESQENSAARRIEAKGAYLAQVIRRWEHIATADVMIDATSDRRIGGGRQPTATVQITTREGVKPDKNLIRSAAATVAGAQSGLARSRVTVVINGVTYKVPDDDAAGNFNGSDDILSAQQQAEQYYATKLQEQLVFVPNVLVKCTVGIDSETKSIDEHKVDPKGIAKVETQQKTSSDETSSPELANGGSEPGAMPNAGMTVNPSAPVTGGAGATTSNNTTEMTTYKADISTTDTKTISPAGRHKVTGVSVRVPRSYLVSIWKQKQGDQSTSAKEPDDAMLNPIIDEQMPNILRDVKACTDLKSDEAIAVSTYFDLTPTMLAAPQTTPVSSSGGLAGIFGGHYKEIGVGALALMSLFMVSGMVKKSNVPMPVIPPSLEVGEIPQLGSEDHIAGDVGEGNSMLDGIEMDADSVKAQQMVDQVSTLVKENPDAAATLVKRWLNRT